MSASSKGQIALYHRNDRDGKSSKPADSNGRKSGSPHDVAGDFLEKALCIGLLGRSHAHFQILRELHRASRVDAEVLLVGETGVGKELYARYVHECSSRAGGEFVAINCGAIPQALFENEMFGHSAGAYTDARTRSAGLVAAAQGGTLFFDEVEALPAAAQVKLLRLLQERQYRRLGETRLRRADVHVISAANTDPAEAIEEGRLRQDLYYRLNVIQKHIPPLRERPDDVDLLLDEFAARYSTEYGLAPIQFPPEARQLLCAYHWPGNIRQLENIVRSLACQHPGKPVQADSLPVVQPRESVRAYVAEHLRILLSLPLCDAKRRIVEHFELQYVRTMLQRAGGNISHAAKLARKNRRAFFELMRKYGIDADEFKNARPGKTHAELLRRKKPR